MMQAPLSEPRVPVMRKGWISRLDALARNPRFLAAALAFSAVNAAAAVTVLMWTPAPPQTAAVPKVTVAPLAPQGTAQSVIVHEVVHRLPPAQTWWPPHMLPDGRSHAALPDLPRSLPHPLARPHLDSLPEADTAPAEPILASLPRVVSPDPQEEVRNASLMPVQTERALPPLVRPRARPAEAAAPAPEALAGLTSSLRPRLRPEGLFVPETPRVAEDATEAPAATTLAALDPQVLPKAQRPAVSGPTCNTRLARAIPSRKGSASGGASVMSGLMNVGGTDRDRIVAREIMAGNMPSFLQELVPVEVSGRARDGSAIRITFCAMPDYLAVGSDRDFVRVPMGLPAAMQIAERFDMLLPTRRMVDQIYRAADLRVAPMPMTPGPQMSSTDYLVRHNRTVEGQVRGASAAGRLTSGHKKDLVLTNRLSSNRGRVAIYGWHRTNGQAIQPLSTVHGATYADYSHGVRLISQTAYLNGKPVRLTDLMADPDYAALISDEGPIRAAQLQVASAN